MINMSDDIKKFKLFILAAALPLILVAFLTSCDISLVGASLMPQAANSGNAAKSGGGRLTFTEKTPYNSDTAVVVNTTADVYENADRTSRRLTQLMFGEPVQTAGLADRWVNVYVDERIEGWVRYRNLDSDWTCVDGRRYSGRIVITNREKQIYSHPRNGIVIRDVGMGTELFIVGKSDNVYQVALPGNLTGWVSENGVFQLGVDEEIKKTTAAIFAQSCEKFRGTSYLLGGISFHGIDGAGMLYVAAKINGLPMPRDFIGQYGEGIFIEEGLNALEAGDVLFFSLTGGSSDVGDAGVYTGDGKFIHANQHTGKVQYEDISDPYFQQRLLSVKRFF